VAWSDGGDEEYGSRMGGRSREMEERAAGMGMEVEVRLANSRCEKSRVASGGSAKCGSTDNGRDRSTGGVGRAGNGRKVKQPTASAPLVHSLLVPYGKQQEGL
jgi:hypothetical protein